MRRERKMLQRGEKSPSCDFPPSFSREWQTFAERKKVLNEFRFRFCGKAWHAWFFLLFCSTNLYDRAVPGPDPARPAREAVLETVR